MPNSVSGVKRQGIVGKDGKIDIRPHSASDEVQDETAYLLSTDANRRHLMASIQSAETGSGLISFTPEEWNKIDNS